MKYFWKLGTIILILLNFAITQVALAQDQTNSYDRYNLSYATPAASTVATPATKKTTTTTPKAPAKTSKKPAEKSTANTQHKTAASPSIYSKQVVQESRSLPYCSAIDISGPFKVNIVSSDGRQTVVLKGNVNAVPRVTTQVRGNTLVIRMLPSKTGKLVPPYDSRVAIQIKIPNELAAVTAGGATQINGTEVYSSHLSITTVEQSSVYLRGDIVVDKIICNSSGFIDIAVGHVQGVSVGGSGSGVIRITGTANVLVAVLGGWLQLDATNLRTKTVYITTWGAAVGQVLPVVALYAFARGSSNIFYYKQPEVMSGNSKGSGNILRLGNWQ